MLCMHCLEEGDWIDEDKCPACEKSGHSSPWKVGKCPACNEEFFAKLRELQERIDLRSNFNTCLAELQAQVAQLKERVTQVEKGTEQVRRP